MRVLWLQRTTQWRDGASDQESGSNGRQLASVLKRETSFTESSSVLFSPVLFHCAADKKADQNSLKNFSQH